MGSTFENLFSKLVPINLKNEGETILYTPQGGAQKSISCIFLKDTFQTFYKTSMLKDFDAMEVQISSRNDTEGNVSVKIAARDGAGDTLISTTVNSGVPWYVHDILEKDVCGFHRLYITTSRLIPDRAQ